MSSPASERAEPIAPHVHVTHILRPSYGARTAQRAVPTTALTFSYYQKDGQMNRIFRLPEYSLLAGLRSTLFQTGTPRSGQSNEASDHPDAAQTSACSKYTRLLVGFRRSFVRNIPGRRPAVRSALLWNAAARGALGH